MTDDLDIPSFLRRDGEDNPISEPELDGTQPPTLEQLLVTIKELTAKREQLTELISRLKKQVQRMVGAL